MTSESLTALNELTQPREGSDFILNIECRWSTCRLRPVQLYSLINEHCTAFPKDSSVGRSYLILDGMPCYHAWSRLFNFEEVHNDNGNIFMLDTRWWGCYNWLHATHPIFNDATSVEELVDHTYPTKLSHCIPYYRLSSFEWWRLNSYTLQDPSENSIMTRQLFISNLAC